MTNSTTVDVGKTQISDPQRNLYQGRVDGIKLTLGSLNAKLAEIDTNTDLSPQERDKAKADISSLITNCKAQQELNQILASAKVVEEAAAKRQEGVIEQGDDVQNERKKGWKLQFSSPQEAQDAADKIAGIYRSLGLKCEVSKTKGGIEISVHLPENFKGEDPLTMAPKRLQEMKEAAQKENNKGITVKPDEKSAKSEEHPVVGSFTRHLAEEAAKHEKGGVSR
jgi:hypothetical protein